MSSEFRQGWRALAAATGATAVGASLFVYTAGLFVKPIAADTGWSRAEIATGATMAMLVQALLTPMVGALVDRYGSRRVGTIAIFGLGLAIWMLAMIPGMLFVYYAALLLIALFGSGATVVTFAPTVVCRFERWRGVSLGILMSGTALLLIPFAPVLQQAIVGQGWRGGYALVGAVVLLIGLPCALLLSPVNRGGVGDDDGRQKTNPAIASTDFSDAIRTSTYWKILIGTIAATLPLGGFVNQMPALLSDHGLTQDIVALMTSLFVASVVVGRGMAGFLLDRLHPPLVALLLMLSGATAALVLLFPQIPVGIYGVVVAMLGVAMGAEADMQAFFIARSFGLKAFARLFGTTAMSTAIAMGLGALLFGWVHDQFGDYRPACMFAILFFILSGTLFFSLRRKEILIAPV